MNMITTKLNVDELILMALREDISSEDITTNSVMREKKMEESSLYANRMVLLLDFIYLNVLLNF